MSLDERILRFLDKQQVRWTDDHKLVPSTLLDLITFIQKHFLSELYWTRVGAGVLAKVDGEPNAFIQWLEDNPDKLDKYTEGDTSRDELVVEYNDLTKGAKNAVQM